MYEPIQTISGITSLICAALISVVVLSDEVQEGPVIKFGLILMIFGLLASGVITLKGFDTLYGLWNASLMTRCGLMLALLGHAWRLKFRKLESKLK